MITPLAFSLWAASVAGLTVVGGTSCAYLVIKHCRTSVSKRVAEAVMRSINIEQLVYQKLEA